MMGALSKATTENTLGVISLGSTLLKAIAVTTELNKTFISTGRQQMIAGDNLRKTFNHVGMSMTESLKMFTTMHTAGVDSSNKATQNMLRKFSVLGKDMQAATTLFALNTQTLGFSTESSILLNESLLETAAAYHMDANVLAKSMNALASTLISTSTTYGKETAMAVQMATSNMIGKYGASNAKLVEELASKLFAGNEQSTKMAATLSLDISKLATSSAKEAQSMMEQALTSLRSKVGASAGEGSSGFVLPRLIEAFGATPGMLALANLGPQTEAQAALTAEQLAAQQVQASFSQSMEQLMTQLTVGLVPVIQAISPWIERGVGLITMGNGILIKIATSLMLMKGLAVLTSMAAKTATFLRGKFHMEDKGIWGGIKSSLVSGFSRVTAAVTRGNISKGASSLIAGGWGRGLAKVAGLLGGPIGIGIAAGATFLPMLFGSSKDQEETQKTSLDELKKQTELIEGSKNDKVLKAIHQGIVQTNIYSELITRFSEEQLEALNNAPGLSLDPVQQQPYVL